MTIALPSIKPSSRTFQAPKWPTTTSVSQGGVVTRRLWGSKPSTGSMSLSFDNISDDNAAAIVAAYNAAKGPTTEVELSSEILSGMSEELKTGIASSIEKLGLKWFFAEDGPSVESVAPGRSSVRLDLIAELREA